MEFDEETGAEHCPNDFHLNNLIWDHQILQRLYFQYLWKIILKANRKQYKQESIPVGCVLPALVATTRYQYRGLGIWCTYPLRYTYPPPRNGPGTRDTYPPPPHGRDLRPEISPQKGPGTRETYPPERTCDQRYLPPREHTDTCENTTFPQFCGR